MQKEEEGGGGRRKEEEKSRGQSPELAIPSLSPAKDGIEGPKGACRKG